MPSPSGTPLAVQEPALLRAVAPCRDCLRCGLCSRLACPFTVRFVHLAFGPALRLVDASVLPSSCPVPLSFSVLPAICCAQGCFGATGKPVLRLGGMEALPSPSGTPLAVQEPALLRAVAPCRNSLHCGLRSRLACPFTVRFSASRLQACLAPRRCFRASFVLPCSAFFFRIACHLLCTRLFRRYGKAGASSWRHGSLAFVSRHAHGCAGASFAESGCTVPEQSSLWASLTACLSLYRAVCASRLRACLASPVWMPSPSDTPLAVLEPTA